MIYFNIMSLNEELKGIIGRRRKFLLLRIADIDLETARKLCKVPVGTYNSWIKDENFRELYRRRDEFSVSYKIEAIQLLRRTNQLNAVLMEEKVIAKMKEEIESGNYDLIRTNLARAVYDKLMSDLDYRPESLALTWEQRVAQLVTALPQQEIIEGEVRQIEEGQGDTVIDGEVQESAEFKNAQE